MFNCMSNSYDDMQNFQFPSTSQQYFPKLNKRTRSRRRKERNVLFYELKRKAANERERKRMYSINEAFDKLRHQLPRLPRDRKLSKASTLREAIRYIRQLSQLLSGEQPIEQNTQPEQPVIVKTEEERSSVIVPNSDGHLPMKFLELSCSKVPDDYGSVIRTEHGTIHGRCSKVWMPTRCEYDQFRESVIDAVAVDNNLSC